MRHIRVLYIQKNDEARLLSLIRLEVRDGAGARNSKREVNR